MNELFDIYGDEAVVDYHYDRLRDIPIVTLVLFESDSENPDNDWSAQHDYTPDQARAVAHALLKAAVQAEEWVMAQ